MVNKINIKNINTNIKCTKDDIKYNNHNNVSGGYTFDIGTVSIAWLSGTIFAHKIEIRTQQLLY